MGDKEGIVLPYNGNLKELSRQLRENMTDAERHLWEKIRRKQIKGYQFYRQKPIGDCIVDFFFARGLGWLLKLMEVNTFLMRWLIMTG